MNTKTKLNYEEYYQYLEDLKKEEFPKYDKYQFCVDALNIIVQKMEEHIDVLDQFGDNLENMSINIIIAPKDGAITMTLNYGRFTNDFLYNMNHYRFCTEDCECVDAGADLEQANCEA